MKYHIEFDVDFKRNTFGGFYIAIEGIDGSGKTTQVDLLTEYLQKKGHTVVQTREPRKDVGVIGKLIQEILHGKEKVPPVAFQYLFTADREIHHEELIKPSLKSGKTIVSDRCFWSAVPYGILDRGGDLEENSGKFILMAQSILSMYHQFTVPDITFYLDIPLDVAMKRLKSMQGQWEIYEDEEKLKKTIKGYNWLLKEFPKEFTIVDGQKSVEEVHKEILAAVDNFKK